MQWHVEDSNDFYTFLNRHKFYDVQHRYENDMARLSS